MLELGVAIRMVAPLPRFAVGLATVVQLPQQLANYALADLEALRGQCLHKVALAAADPAQRRGRIAANRVLDQPLQRSRQLGLLRHRALAPSTRPAQVARPARCGPTAVPASRGRSCCEPDQLLST